jgi:hypothetical protein
VTLSQRFSDSRRIIANRARYQALRGDLIALRPGHASLDG